VTKPAGDGFDIRTQFKPPNCALQRMPLRIGIQAYSRPTDRVYREILIKSSSDLFQPAIEIGIQRRNDR
jgi:hypothetical protein